jgi:hypothetical protein
LRSRGTSDTLNRHPCSGTPNRHPCSDTLNRHPCSDTLNRPTSIDPAWRGKPRVEPGQAPFPESGRRRPALQRCFASVLPQFGRRERRRERITITSTSTTGTCGYWATGIYHRHFCLQENTNTAQAVELRSGFSKDAFLERCLGCRPKTWQPTWNLVRD